MRELPCFADPSNLVGPEDELELFELAPGETSLSFLQKIYRSPRQPNARGDRSFATRASKADCDGGQQHERGDLCRDARPSNRPLAEPLAPDRTPR